MSISLLVCLMVGCFAIPVLAQDLADEVEHDGSTSGLFTGEPIRSYDLSFGEGETEPTEVESGEAKGIIAWISEALRYGAQWTWSWLYQMLDRLPAMLFFPVNLTVPTWIPTDQGNESDINSATMIAAYYGFFARAVAIALVMIIGYYGLRMVIGRVEIPPIAFFTRMVFVVLGLSVGLQLMQDVLNINNFLVYSILNPSSELFGSRANVVQGSVWRDMLRTMGTSPNVGIAEALIALLVIVVLAIQLLYLWVMSFARMWEIYLLAIVSPIAFASLLLPSWSGIWGQWLNLFLRVTFQQLIWVTIFKFGSGILATLIASSTNYIFILISLITFAGLLMTGGGIVMNLLGAVTNAGQPVARTAAAVGMGGMERRAIGMRIQGEQTGGFAGFGMRALSGTILTATGAESFVTTGKWGYIDRAEERKQQLKALGQTPGGGPGGGGSRDPADDLSV